MGNKISKNVFKSIIFLILLVSVFCEQKPETTGEKIAASLGIKDNPASPFYLDLSSYPSSSGSEYKNLPIGVFDSGTGGLTVFEAILKYDGFDNENHNPVQGGDGAPDFKNEDFEYLGDLANMPYGIYPSEGRTNFLEELCAKDGLFLLNNFYDDPEKSTVKRQKSPVKIIVIACNTGTAYGKHVIEEMLDYLGLDIDVIGVVDAGSLGGLRHFKKDESGTIGVMGTLATVSSNAYPGAIRDIIKKDGYTGKIDIFQQGAYGIAEAIDTDPEFIDYNWKGTGIRDNYRGPSLTSEEFKIHEDILDLYNFSFEGNELLVKKSGDKIVDMQLNSARNYTRFHVTNLILKLKEQNAQPPLKSIVLGCTHYPYMIDEIAEQLSFLADYVDENGDKPFSSILSEPVNLVDPAKLTAHETFIALKKRQAFTEDLNPVRAFFVSVPNSELAGIRVNEQNRFPYEYKYSREPFYLDQSGSFPPKYVLRAPMRWSTLNDIVIEQIKERLPLTYQNMKTYNEKVNAN